MLVQNIETIDKNLLNLYLNSQSEVPSTYAEDSFSGERYVSIEKQSASFLTAFIEGNLIIDPLAFDTMSQYLKILKSSSFEPIVQILSTAEKKHKLAVLEYHKAQEAAQALAAKKKAHIQYLSANQFVILQKKEALQLSSSDLLLIKELLQYVTAYKTKFLKDKLNSLIQNKINKTLSGELSADADFAKLAKSCGSLRQLQALEKRNAMAKNRNSESHITVTAATIPVHVSSSYSVNRTPYMSSASKSNRHSYTSYHTHEDFSKPTTVPHSEPIADNPIVAEPLQKKTITVTSAAQEPTSSAIAERMAFLRQNDFAILQSKQKTSLTASDLLLIDKMLEIEDKKSSSRSSKRSTGFYSLAAIRGFKMAVNSLAQNIIERTLKHKIAYTDDVGKLVHRFGTPQQQLLFRNAKTDFEDHRPLVHKTAVTPSTDMVKNPTIPVSHSVKKKNSSKMPWYKKTLRVVATVAIATLASLGFAKVLPSLLPHKSTGAKIKTEQKIKQKKQPQKVATINFTDVQTKRSQTPNKVVAINTKEDRAVTAAIDDNVLSAYTSKNDDKFYNRIAAFRESQDKLGINLDNLSDIVKSQISAGNIELSNTITFARAQYIVAFYAQYPGSKAGQICRALLNHENVSFNSHDFQKWDKELGTFGTKFRKTLGKKTTRFSPMVHASAKVKQDFIRLAKGKSIG